MVRQGDLKTLANILHHFLHTRLGITNGYPRTTITASHRGDAR